MGATGWLAGKTDIPSDTVVYAVAGNRAARDRRLAYLLVGEAAIRDTPFVLPPA
jgi:hypothetical protein